MLAKKFAVGFGIAIIFPMMIHYGVSTFSDPPCWEDYQTKNYYERYEHGTEAERKQLEQEQNKLQEQYQKEETRFQKHLFSVSVPLGILGIIIGALLPIPAIGTGLMFGGIFSICDGYCNYWAQLDDAWRFASLVAAFIVLLFIGFKKLECRTHL